MTGGKITKESFELIADEILCLIEFTNSYDEKKEIIKNVLVDNGIIEIIED